MVLFLLGIFGLTGIALLWRKQEEKKRIVQAFDEKKESRHYKKIVANCIEKKGRHHMQTAEAQLNLGRAYAQEKKYAQASQLYQEAVTIFEEKMGLLDPQVGYVYTLIADAKKKEGNKKESIQALKKALKIYAHNFGEKSLKSAPIYQVLAKSYHEIDKKEESLEFYTISKEIYDASGDAYLLKSIEVILRKGEIYEEKKAPDKAIQLYQMGVKRALKQKKRDIAGDLEVEIGRVQSQKNPEAALVAYQKALDHYKESNQGEEKMAKAYTRIGRALFLLGQEEGAVEKLLKAKEIYEKKGGLKGQAERALTYFWLAEIFSQKGERKESIAYFHKALESNQESAHKIFHATHIKERLANEYLKAGEEKKAKKYFQEILERGKKEENLSFSPLPSTCMALGFCHQEAGENQRAEMYYHEAEKHYHALDKGDDVGHHITEGLIYQRKDPQRAFKAYKMGLDRFKKEGKSNKKQLLFLYTGLAISAYGSKSYKESLHYFKESLPYLDKKKKSHDGAMIFFNMSLLFFRQKSYRKAQKWAKKALLPFHQMMPS